MLEFEFRANPDYEIVTFEQMNPTELRALSSLRDDPECFGILRPKAESGLRIKSVCPQTALLFQSLRTGGKLPSSLLNGLGEEANEQISTLLLEDVLQVARNGGFESGASVHDLIYASQSPNEQLGRLGQLSLDAVKHAQRLPIDDPLRLSAQMYFYHRTPVTPQWCRRIGDPEALSRFLGTDTDGRCAKPFRAFSPRVSSSPMAVGWNSWTLRNTAGLGNVKRYDYKLYVSPTLESLPDVLPVVVDVFAEARVRQFKIGADLPGLTRPDKIVSYFEDFAHLQRVSDLLIARVVDTPPHGVPFTAELCPSGLLSWGMDPHEAPVVDGQDKASWRLWVTNRLAVGLIDAKRSNGSTRGTVEPWEYALQRLRLDGVDTDTWAPTQVYEEKIQGRVRNDHG